MTPSKTPFASLERLGPGDLLSADGFAFQDIDRLTIDQLLRLGAVTHTHDAHAALVNPSLAPVLATATSGGQIPAGQAIYVTYTLIDNNGGETAPIAAQTITTPAGYSTPTVAPSESVAYTAGTLLAGNYSYGITVTDGLGGETRLGPTVLATVNPGFPTAEVTLTGLVAAMNSASGGAGGAGWRLWRQQGGGPWYLVGTGTGNTFTDSGVAGDCTVSPPAIGTTKGANTLTVTVPGGQPAAAVNFNLYVSLDGSFTSPALLGTYPAADFGVAQTFTALAPSSGAPPVVSRAFPGANPIDAMTQLINLLRAAGTLPTNVQGGSYVFAQTDVGLIVESTSATPVTFTVPNHATVPFDYPGLPGANGGATIEVFQYGAGQVTIAGGVGVTLRSDTGRVKTATQYSTIGLRQRAADEWVLSGDLA